MKQNLPLNTIYLPDESAASGGAGAPAGGDSCAASGRRTAESANQSPSLDALTTAMSTFGGELEAETQFLPVAGQNALSQMPLEMPDV